MTDIQVPADGRLRLFSFVRGSGDAGMGAALPGGVFADLGPASMMEIVSGGHDRLDQVRREVAANLGVARSLTEVTFLPPLPYLARNIYCVGWNYLDHFEEGANFRERAEPLPESPVFFTKGVSSLNGPFDAIPYDANVSRRIDWEVELAVVIGTAGKNIPETRALDNVFGYTVINDISARDLQKRHGGQWFKGKSLDGHGPMGPWIVPATDFDPSDARLLCRVNGQTKQDGSTKQMYFKVPRIIAELSRGMTLVPGDIIATGTPPGVGFARTPPEYLKPGDVLETEVAGLGTLRNVIGSRGAYSR